MTHWSEPRSASAVFGRLLRFAPPCAGLLAVLLVDATVLGAVLFGRLRYASIAVHEPSYLKWALYSLDEISLVFGFNARLTATSLPALGLASGQVGLLAAWIWLGRSPAVARWLVGGAAIWLWSCVLPFVHGWAFTVSQSGALFAAQALTVLALLLVLPRSRLRLDPACDVQTADPRRLAKWQYTLGGMLLAMTVTGAVLGVLSYLTWDGWILLEGAACGVITVAALAATCFRRGVIRLTFGMVVPAAVGYALMWSFDSRHRWWGPGAHLPGHWAFAQYYLPYIAWMLMHAACVVAVVVILRVAARGGRSLAAVESETLRPSDPPGT